MGKPWVIAVFASACSFSAHGPAGEPPGAPDAAAMTTPPQCSVTDPTLKLCIDFSEPIASPMIIHDLGPLDHNGTASGIGFLDRNGNPAIGVTGSSLISIPPTTDLELGAPLTVELFFQQTAAARAYVLDGGGYYSITVDSSGRPTCNVGDANGSSVSTSWNTPVTAGKWTHIACTYDGAALQLFVDGVVAGCSSGPITLPTTPSLGVAIGSQARSATSFSNQLVGGLDDVHVYASVVPAATICAHAGGSTCNTACPTGGGGG